MLQILSQLRVRKKKMVGCNLPRWGRRAGKPSWWWRRWWAASEQLGSSEAAAQRRFVGFPERAPLRGPPPAPWIHPPSPKTSGRLADKQKRMTCQWRLHAWGAMERKWCHAEIRDMQDLVRTVRWLMLGSTGPKSRGQQSHTQFLSSSHLLLHWCSTVRSVVRRNLLSIAWDAAYDLRYINAAANIMGFLSAQTAGEAGANLSCSKVKAGSHPLQPTLAVHHRVTPRD